MTVENPSNTNVSHEANYEEKMESLLLLGQAVLFEICEGVIEISSSQDPKHALMKKNLITKERVSKLITLISQEQDFSDFIRNISMEFKKKKVFLPNSSEFVSLLLGSLKDEKNWIGADASMLWNIGESKLRSENRELHNDLDGERLQILDRLEKLVAELD